LRHAIRRLLKGCTPVVVMELGALVAGYAMWAAKYYRP
jgi:hypothetical protein